jgi:hypothetical protein
MKQAEKALELAHRLCTEALPKFNWAASALDANAIDLLNRAPMAVHAALPSTAWALRLSSACRRLAGYSGCLQTEWLPTQ